MAILNNFNSQTKAVLILLRIQTPNLGQKLGEIAVNCLAMGSRSILRGAEESGTRQRDERCMVLRNCHTSYNEDSTWHLGSLLRVHP